MKTKNRGRYRSVNTEPGADPAAQITPPGLTPATQRQKRRRITTDYTARATPGTQPEGRKEEETTEGNKGNKGVFSECLWLLLVPSFPSLPSVKEFFARKQEVDG